MEIYCKDAVFHFNKKHLEDPNIPMWVIKTKGKTYYIEHLECNVPWSTKETPNNPHTKGSLKFKNCLLNINNENTATLNPATDEDKERLQSEPPTRIITDNRRDVSNFLVQRKIDHGDWKGLHGSCGTPFSLVQLGDPKDVMLLALSLPNDFRVLNPNEEYWKAYDDDALREKINGDAIGHDFHPDTDYYDDDDEEYELCTLPLKQKMQVKLVELLKKTKLSMVRFLN